MGRFRYRMESILNIKLKMEEQAKMSYSLAQLALNEEEEKLAGLYQRQTFYLEEGRQLRESVLDVKELRANTTAQQTIKEYIQNQILEVEKATAKVEEEREKLRLAQQERKTQEKLKEKAFEAFLQEEKRAEGKEVDELVSYVYGQKQ